MKSQYQTLYMVALLTMSCYEIDEDETYFVQEDVTSIACIAAGNDEDALSCQLAYLTNEKRRINKQESNSAQPLVWDYQLAQVARSYSQKMCDENFFDHADIDGLRLEGRLDEAGIGYVKAGENLARGISLDPETVMAHFMNEPECAQNHRSNVLDNDFTHIGVGTVACKYTTIYTQLFATFEHSHLKYKPNEYCKMHMKRTR